MIRAFLFMKNLYLSPYFALWGKKRKRFFEQKIDSQNGEDGIIKHIFHKIGTTNKFCVEFGIHAEQGNTINLSKKGWQCLWMDGGGDGDKIKKEFITAENINQLFEKYHVPKDVDLLSIDIDYNDYWIWKAIEGYNPRVVIVEYNASIPPNESRTVPYDPTGAWDGTTYFGASLLALQKLATSKGYTLVYCDKRGVNSFFVRNELINDQFEIKTIEETYRPPRYRRYAPTHPPSDKQMIVV